MAIRYYLIVYPAENIFVFHPWIPEDNNKIIYGIN